MITTEDFLNEKPDQQALVVNEALVNLSPTDWAVWYTFLSPEAIEVMKSFVVQLETIVPIKDHHAHIFSGGGR